MNAKQRKIAEDLVASYIHAKMNDIGSIHFFVPGFTRTNDPVAECISSYKDTVTLQYDNSNSLLKPIDILKIQELIGAKDVKMTSSAGGDEDSSIGIICYIEFTFVF